MPKPLDGIVIRNDTGRPYLTQVLTTDGASICGIGSIRLELDVKRGVYEAHLTALDPQIDIPLASWQVRIAFTDMEGNPVTLPRSAEGLMTQGPAEGA